MTGVRYNSLLWKCTLNLIDIDVSRTESWSAEETDVGP